MKLIEVIRGLATSDEVYEIIEEMSLKLEKIPVEVNDFPGFVSNRVLMPMINEAIYTVYEGVATPEVNGILKRKEASDLETTGNKVKATRMSAKETEAYDTSFKATIKSDAKADVIDAVEKEKDSLRDITPFEKEYKHAHAKINHLNKEYIDKKDEIKAKILANKKNHAKKTPIKKLIDKGNYR